MFREKELITLLTKSNKGLSKKQLRKLVEKFKKLIIDNVPKYEEGVHLKNFGTFKLTVSLPRKIKAVRNLGTLIAIPAKYRLRFYPSATVRKKFGDKRPYRKARPIK
jgi:nucleoid DNA-binding protein